MPIEFPCPSCSKLLRTPDASAGKKAKCPQCAAIVDIPVGSYPSPPQPSNIPPSFPPSNPFPAPVPPSPHLGHPFPSHNPYHDGSSPSGGVRPDDLTNNPY